MWCSTVPPHAFSGTCSRHLAGRRPRRPSGRRRIGDLDRDAAGQADARDGPRGRVLGRLRPRPRQPADPLRVQARRTAGPRIGREALHDGLRPHALRTRCDAAHLGRGAGLPRSRRRLARRPLPARRRRSHARARRPAAPGGRGRRGRSPARGRVGPRRRVALRQPARLLRHPRRLRPRHRRGPGRADAQPGLLEGRQAGRRGGAAVREGPARRRHPRRGPQRGRQRAGRRTRAGQRPLAADARPHPADQRPDPTTSWPRRSSRTSAPRSAGPVPPRQASAWSRPSCRPSA